MAFLGRYACYTTFFKEVCIIFIAYYIMCCNKLSYILYRLNLLEIWTFSHNKISDRNGYQIRPYSDSTDLLKKLHGEGYEIGIASRTSATKEAYDLIKLLEWDKYIKYYEIYPGSKTSHFQK